MHSRIILVSGALLSAAVGCRDDVSSPVEPGSVRTPAAIGAASTLSFWQVSVGPNHTCAVTTDNRVYCWGWNPSGQLGDGTTDGHRRPAAVATALRFRQVSVGIGHSCGVTTDDQAWCWGANSSGALGNGATTDAWTPARVAGGQHFRQVDAGAGQTCGITLERRLFCWGFNREGQLGDGTTTDRSIPVLVAGGLAFRQVSGGFDHSCAVTTDSRAYCWGSNSYGQIGDSTRVVRRLRPSPVAGGRSLRQIDAGGMHTCAVDFSGRAFCWGNGENGQIGNGTITRVSFWPRRVAGVIRFDRVTAEGWYSSCAESSTNQAYCWGDNREGQLGDGTKAPRLVPTAVVGGLRFRQLSINGFSACGKTDEATLYCWGYNGNGQLGDGTTTRRLTPTPVADPE